MPNEYTSAYAPMQSNAQYTQPQIMGQGSQEAMHNAMLAQQQQYNNQAAQIASKSSPMSSMGGMNPLMLAQALRKGGTTPQGAYAQQGQYMQDATNNPMTQQQMDLYNQGGAEMMSFNNPMGS